MNGKLVHDTGYNVIIDVHRAHGNNELSVFDLPYQNTVDYSKDAPLRKKDWLRHEQK